MELNFDTSKQPIQEGDLIQINNNHWRMIIHDSDEGYAFLDLENGSVTTDFYEELEDLLICFTINDIIKNDSLKLSIK